MHILQKLWSTLSNEFYDSLLKGEKLSEEQRQSLIKLKDTGSFDIKETMSILTEVNAQNKAPKK